MTRGRSGISGRCPLRTVADPPSVLYVVEEMGNLDLGLLLRALRGNAGDENEGLNVAEASRRTALWTGKPVSDSFWSQVEKGKSRPSESQLLRMALAVNAEPEDIRMLFEAAGYHDLFHYLVGIGLVASTRHNLVFGAEAGILTDSRLPSEKRKELLSHLNTILEAEEARKQRERAEGAAS